MLKKLIVYSLLLASFCCSASILEIVKYGKANALIVIPSEDDGIVADAAKCMNHYLKKISGTELNVKKENELGNYSGNIISLGATQMASQAGINTTGIEKDGYKIKRIGNTLFILGPDKHFKIRKSGNEFLDNYIKSRWKSRWTELEAIRGTLNGVIGFLYDYCGVRWFIPSPEGERIIKKNTISLPENVNISYNPPFHGAFAWCGIPWAYKPGFYWAAANAFRLPLSYLHLGGHSWDFQIKLSSGSLKKLFEEHPEYFQFYGGKRTLNRSHPNIGAVLCTSNPKVVDMLSQSIDRVFSQGWDIFPYNQSDGYGRCRCENCEAMDKYRGYLGGKFKKPCERLLVPFNEIAERLYKKHPDKKILMMVYGPTKLPSEKIKKFPPNVILQMCHSEKEDFDRWKGIAPTYAVWLYWLGMYQKAGVSVKYTPGKAAENLKLFYERGVKLLYWGCGSGGINWGTEGPVYYTIGQMLRDPKRDYRQIVEEYCNGIYGKAAPVMLKFFDLLYSRLDKYISGKYIFRNYKAREAQDFFYTVYSGNILEKLEKLLDEADKTAQTERTKNWLKLSRNQFNYIKNLYNVFNSYQNFLAARNIQNFNTLKDSVAAFRNYINDLKTLAKNKDFIENYYPGYQGFKRFAEYYSGKKLFWKEAPFNWDFENPSKYLLSENESGKNLLEDPSFEICTRDAGWVLNCAESVNNPIHSGNKSLCFKPEIPQKTGTPFRTIIMPITGGKEYRIGIWVNIASKIAVDPFPRELTLCLNLYRNGRGIKRNEVLLTFMAPKTYGWTFLYTYWKAPADVNGIIFHVRCSGYPDVYFDDAEISQL